MLQHPYQRYQFFYLKRIILTLFINKKNSCKQESRKGKRRINDNDEKKEKKIKKRNGEEIEKKRRKAYRNPSHIATYINGLIKIIGPDDTCQS